MPVSQGDTLARMEAERQRLASFTTTWGIASAVAALVVLAATREFHWPALTAIAGVLLVVVGVSPGLARLKRQLQRDILPNLVREVAPTLDYQVGRAVARTEFVDSKLFQAPDRYSSEHRIDGMLGDTAVHFGMVMAEEQVTERDSDGKTRTTYQDLFTGLYFVADFNKHFSGRTVVRPYGTNFFTKLFGSVIELEDPEFDEHFCVSATDEVEARYIFSPALMDRFKSLRERMGGFHASFDRGSLILAVPMKWDLFDVKLFTALDGPGGVAAMQAALVSVVGIVDELDLNTRIWTKQASPD